MKKAAIYGAIAGAGFFLLIGGGMYKPYLSWPVVAMIAGVALVVWGITNFSKEVDL